MDVVLCFGQRTPARAFPFHHKFLFLPTPRNRFFHTLSYG